MICIAHGFGKGAVRMIISSVGCIAALAAAVFVSGAADEYVYESFVRPSVLSVLEKKADELSEKYFSEEYFGKILSQNGIKPDGEQSSELSSVPEEFYEVLTNEDFRAKLNSVFISYCQSLTDAFSGILPEEVLDGAGSYINELESENERKLEMLTFDKKSAAELVEREMIRPIIMRVVRTALFVVTFAVVSGVFTVISYAARAARGIRAVRSADDILGGIIGCLQASRTRLLTEHRAS